MKIMSINAGSSSLKFSLFNMENESVITNGLFERIGIEGSCYTIKYNGEKIVQEVELNTHTDAVKILLDKLLELNIISSLDEINGIGHRIVHGGDRYSESVIVTDEVVNYIDDIKDLAPLHNPAHILGINAFREVLPDVPMVVVFDTAYHQTMDASEYLYPVPYSWYQKYRIRKYGFHGTSHRYIAMTIANELKRNDLKVISCHIGNGGSITAIKDGKCVSTSMGFTPLAGIMMGSRSGDVDCSIIPYVMEKEGLNALEVVNELNKKSGLIGLSELSSDMRDVIKGMREGNEKCALAFDKYCRIATNYIAQYYVLLGGCDVICFTAGVGENSSMFREKVCNNLACLGIKIDLEFNDTFSDFRKISSDDSSVLVYIVPTDEELMIARDTLKLIQNR
ncbi:MAG: acetate kinase [Bacilli bacterium]|nr:acetate kinase [Bacilli bacterium]